MKGRTPRRAVRFFAPLAALLWAAPVFPDAGDVFYGLELVGGQYLFAGERGNFSGNVSGYVAGTFSAGERWTFLPSLSSRYQGTKQVLDLVGAGSLFQQQMDHRLAVKAVRREPGSKWALKGLAAYKAQFLKETRDEEWLKGLFDYRMLDVGAEIEYVYAEPHSVRFSVDHVRTDFPNYTSLESQITLDFQGRPLARELAGDSVLDTRAYLFTAQASFPLRGGWSGENSLSFSWQAYPQQRVVEGSGLLSADDRRDFLTRWRVGARGAYAPRIGLRLEPGLSFGIDNTASNQNSYDALRTEYLPGYYNFVEYRLSPSLTARLGDSRLPAVAALSGSAAFRRHAHRKTQNASGTYREERLRQASWLVSASFSYPVSPFLSLVMNIQHGRTTSNQDFEQFYSYNYTATNYLAGLRLEY